MQKSRFLHRIKSFSALCFLVSIVAGGYIFAGSAIDDIADISRFPRGMVALNTTRSTYEVGDTALLHMTALDARGHTECDASLRLEIRNPSGDVTFFDTTQGTLQTNPDCVRDSVTDVPDYSARYRLERLGVYTATLTNMATGVQSQTRFEVRKKMPFLMERSGATRINPFKSSYTMRLRFEAKDDFRWSITEQMPENFSLVSQSSSSSGVIFRSERVVRGKRTMTWDARFKKGKTYEISYVYEAPRISPEAHLLGPIKLAGTSDFREFEGWQIASDAACNAITTGNWNDGTKWSGCSGAGGVPNSSDDVTINSGVIMTVTADASVNSVVVAVNAAAGSANGIIINSGITLTVTGNITMNAPTALTSTIDVGAGVLTAASVSIPGSATAGRFATLNISTGTATLSGSVTFSGTAAQARLLITSTGRLNVGGNFGSGGTLSTTGQGTINFNGGAAQTMGAYSSSNTPYQNVAINNTSGGVTFTGSTRFAGTLDIQQGTLSFGTNTYLVVGTTTVSTGGTLTFLSTTGTKTFQGRVVIDGGTWTNTINSAAVFNGGITFNSGTFTSGTGVHTFSVNNQTIEGAGAFTINSITITTITLTNNNTAGFTVLTTFAGTGTFTNGANAILNVTGTTAIAPTLNATASGNIVNYNGTAAQANIKSTTYNHLKINNTAATGASLTTGWATVTTLTIGDIAPTARFQDAGFVLTPSGSSVLNLVQGTYDLGSATVGTSFPSFATINISAGTTVEYGAAVAQAINPTLSYANLLVTGAVGKSIANGSTVSISGNLTMNAASRILNLGTGTYTIGGNVVVTAGTIEADTSAITLTGNIIPAGSAIFNADASTITLSWDISGAGTFTGGTSTLILSGGGTQSLSVTTAVYYNLTLAKTTATTATLATGSAVTVNGTLTVTTGTLVIGGINFTHNGTTSIVDTIDFNNTGGTKIFVGLVTIAVGGTWTNTGNEGVSFRGGLTHNWTTFSAGTGIYTFDTNNQQLNWLLSITMGAVVVTSPCTLTNNIPEYNITGSLTGTGWFTQGAGVILNLTWATNTPTTMTATATGNTVNYAGVGITQLVKATPYYNLGLGWSGARSLTSLATIAGEFSTSGTITATTASAITAGSLVVGSGTTFTVGAGDFTVNGTTSVSGTLANSSITGIKTYIGLMTIESGGSWTNALNEAITFRGGITHNGTTFSAGLGVYTFDTNSQALNGSSSISISSITVTGVTLTSNIDLSVDAALSGTGGLTMAANTTLNIGALSDITTLTVNASGVTVNYYDTVAQTVKATIYQILKINNSAATGATLWGDITLNTLTIWDTASTARFQDGGYTITLSGSSVLNLTQGSYELGSATVGTSFPAFGTLNIASGTTIEYASAVAQNVSGTPSYHHLLFTGVGTKTVQGSLSVAGNMTVNTASQTVNMGSYTGHVITGNLVVTAGILDADTSMITLSGGLTGGGTFNGDGGTLSLTGGNAQAISVTTLTLNNLTLEKTTATTASIAAATTINGTLTITSGTLSIGGVNFTHNGATSISGTIEFTSITGGKTFTGAVTINSGGVWDNTIGEGFTFRGGLTHNGATFTGGTAGIYLFDTNDQAIGGTSALSIPNITVASGRILTNNNTAGLTVDSALGSTGGTLVQATNAVLNVGGTITLTTLTATATGNTVSYTWAAQTVKPTTYHHLGLAGSDAKTLTNVSTINGNLTMSGTATAALAVDMTIGGNLVIGSGTAFDVLGSYITVNGTTTIAGTLQNSGGGGRKTFVGMVLIDTGGAWDPSGAGTFAFRGGLTHNGATFTNLGTYIFEENNQTIAGTSAISVPDITVTGITLTNNSTAGLSINTALSGTGGLTQGTNAVLNLGGTSAITTLTATGSGNTVSFTSTTAGQTINSTTYHHLTIDKTGQVATLGGAITANGNLTITNGTLDVSSANNYAITVKGDWVNNGTFTAQNGTVTFNSTGNQTINDANTWFGLVISGSTARTVYFESGVAQTVSQNGLLTLTGAPSNTLTLAPLTPSTEWQLHVIDTSVVQTVSDVSVSYSNAGPAITYATIIASGNHDGGNNTNWSFFGGLSIDIVDAAGDPVASPAISMSNGAFSFGYQNTTGTLGVSSQKIRTTNTTGSSPWVMTLAADAGTTSLWSAGTPKYDFNDPTASAGDGGDADSYGGQMTIDPSAGTITPEAGCSTTGLTKWSSASFSEWSLDSITLLTASSGASVNCYWDMTGIDVDQTIPYEQTVGSYAIPMTLTVTAV